MKHTFGLETNKRKETRTKKWTIFPKARIQAFEKWSLKRSPRNDETETLSNTDLRPGTPSGRTTLHLCVVADVSPRSSLVRGLRCRGNRHVSRICPVCGLFLVRPTLQTVVTHPHCGWSCAVRMAHRFVVETGHTQRNSLCTGLGHNPLPDSHNLLRNFRDPCV